jgi:hypothetical protein
MVNQAALPATLAPRLISREAAAAYICISATKFNQLVVDGRMPKPRLIDRRKVWDVHELNNAIDALPSEDDALANPWDANDVG